jgi:hypothetical protein
MKKLQSRTRHSSRRLELHRETLRCLDAVQLSSARGGNPGEPSFDFGKDCPRGDTEPVFLAR